jgi:class 3 adenylate cyclase/pimeloyl-ACP methyl ester carboxylesterase
VPLTPPPVCYAATDSGLRIAYTIQGNGPPLIYVRAFNSHAQQWWTTGWTAAYYGALATRFRVVLVDARGNGLSGPTTEIDLDGLVEDVRVVIEHAELRDVTLFGQGFGAPVAIAYAARHDVSRLILYCAYARGREIFVTDTFIETMRSMPDAAAAFMGRETYPDDEELPARLLSREGIHARPETAVAYFEFVRRVDVTEELALVDRPTLVMQPERNPQIRARLGRDVAEAIPGAVYRVIPGGAYNPYARLSFEPTLAAVGDFCGVQLVGASRRVTLLRTDMVDSTAMTQRAGEQVAKTLHSAHDEIVRTAASAHGAQEVQHTGDGLVLSFPMARDALACAVEIQRRCAERNASADEPLRVRVGIAAGEAYVHNGQPFSSAAQLVTRVTARAGAGEIMVADPVSHPDFALGPAEKAVLKGFPDPVALRRVVTIA